MNIKTNNLGGVGYVIKFPDFVDLEPIRGYVGSYEGSNIERIELEALQQAMNVILEIFCIHKSKLTNINVIKFITDRAGLSDNDKTNAYRISRWRKNGWLTSDGGKPIKNRKMLDKLDKTRFKVAKIARCRVVIEYWPRKYNKDADSLAKISKRIPLSDRSIAIHGLKLGKRKFDGAEVDYRLIKKGSRHVIHIFRKEPVEDQWEIEAELAGYFFCGRKLRIYTDDLLESRLHRHHFYNIKVKAVFNHHFHIYKTFREAKI